MARNYAARAHERRSYAIARKQPESQFLAPAGTPNLENRACKSLQALIIALWQAKQKFTFTARLVGAGEFSALYMIRVRSLRTSRHNNAMTHAAGSVANFSPTRARLVHMAEHVVMSSRKKLMQTRHLPRQTRIASRATSCVGHKAMCTYINQGGAHSGVRAEANCLRVVAQ